MEVTEFFIVQCHLVVKKWRGEVACNICSFCGEASLGGMLQPVLEVFEFLRGLNKPVLPANSHRSQCWLIHVFVSLAAQ